VPYIYEPLATQGMEMNHVQWSRVAEGLSQLTSDLVLWRQVELLEQLGRDGYAACRSDLS
jgi:hypothetical protein